MRLTTVVVNTAACSFESEARPGAIHWSAPRITRRSANVAAQVSHHSRCELTAI